MAASARLVAALSYRVNIQLAMSAASAKYSLSWRGNRQYVVVIRGNIRPSVIGHIDGAVLQWRGVIEAYAGLENSYCYIKNGRHGDDE
jgi:hypothetical protein